MTWHRPYAIYQLFPSRHQWPNCGDFDDFKARPYRQIQGRLGWSQHGKALTIQRFIISPLMRLQFWDALFGQIHLIPCTNPWGQKLEQMAWWLMAEPMRRSSCLGKPNSTNKILLGAQGLRLLHCLQWKWLTAHMLMASGLKSNSFFCFMSISVMESYHQETPLLN